MLRTPTLFVFYRPSHNALSLSKHIARTPAGGREAEAGAGAEQDTAANDLEMSELPELEIPPTQFDSGSDAGGDSASLAQSEPEVWAGLNP